MNDIWELHSVLDEENRDVVSNNVPVTLISIELDSEAPYIADSVCRSTAPKDCRESQENGCFARCVGQDAGRRYIRSRLEQGEFTKRSRTSGMYNTLWNSFVVEAVDLCVGLVK